MGPGPGQGGPGVHHPEHLGAEGHLAAAQAPRVAGAVEALVVGPDGRDGQADPGQRLQDVAGDVGVPVQQLDRLRGQRAPAASRSAGRASIPMSRNSPASSMPLTRMGGQPRASVRSRVIEATRREWPSRPGPAASALPIMVPRITWRECDSESWPGAGARAPRPG